MWATGPVHIRLVVKIYYEGKRMVYEESWAVRGCVADCYEEEPMSTKYDDSDSVRSIESGARFGSDVTQGKMVGDMQRAAGGVRLLAELDECNNTSLEPNVVQVQVKFS